MLETTEGLIRLCTGQGPINIFDIKERAQRFEAEDEMDEQYNPAQPNNYHDMILRKKAILK